MDDLSDVVRLLAGLDEEETASTMEIGPDCLPLSASLAAARLGLPQLSAAHAEHLQQCAHCRSVLRGLVARVHEAAAAAPAAPFPELDFALNPLQPTGVATGEGSRPGPDAGPERYPQSDNREAPELMASAAEQAARWSEWASNPSGACPLVVSLNLDPAGVARFLRNELRPVEVGNRLLATKGTVSSEPEYATNELPQIQIEQTRPHMHSGR